MRSGRWLELDLIKVRSPICIGRVPPRASGDVVGPPFGSGAGVRATGRGYGVRSTEVLASQAVLAEQTHLKNVPKLMRNGDRCRAVTRVHTDMTPVIRGVTVQALASRGI